jgi:hypothetical protein
MPTWLVNIFVQNPLLFLVTSIVVIGTRSSTGTDCIRCPQGRYSWGNTTSCVECSQGYTQPFDGRSSCDICDYGLFAVGTLSCAKCAIGRYTNQQGSMSCTPCGNGTFQPSEGQINCLECPPGNIIISYPLSCVLLFH